MSQLTGSRLISSLSSRRSVNIPPVASAVLSPSSFWAHRFSQSVWRRIPTASACPPGKRSKRNCRLHSPQHWLAEMSCLVDDMIPRVDLQTRKFFESSLSSELCQLPRRFSLSSFYRNVTWRLTELCPTTNVCADPFLPGLLSAFSLGE